LVAEEAIRIVRPRGIIMVGIAFGSNPSKQKLGDVLVSRHVLWYEPQRVGTGDGGSLNKISRAVVNEAGGVLYNRFREIGLRWKTDDASVYHGVVLSGEKLVDNADFKAELLRMHPEAIGGEMEGAGLAAAAARHRTEWLLVKGICDWADGTK